MIKILDRFLIRSFIPPFAVAFGIALFVLIMQFLWLYIDEIMGKGLTIFEISELLFYLSFSLMPQALPIGVLISTVMVMGNLAERYELSSFKSAGVSLVRILRPLMFAVVCVAGFSMLTSEVLIPWSNLKFYARFYDIRKSKPALNLEEGVFNDEFQDYTMRIGKKGRDGRGLENIMIYGNKDFNASQINQIVAQSGEMLNSADRQFIVMNLTDGVQYQETVPNASNAGRFPFIRIKFKSWQKIFDLSEFDRRKTDEGLFKNNQKMLSSRQLWRSMDSMTQVTRNYTTEMLKNINEQFTPFHERPKSDSAAAAAIPIDVQPSASKLNVPPSVSNYDLAGFNKKNTKTPTAKGLKPAASAVGNAALDSFGQSRLAETPFSKFPKPFISTAKLDTFSNKNLQPNFYDIFKKASISEQVAMQQRAETKARNVQQTIENAVRNTKFVIESRGKFVYELNMKYNYALICLVFLFIGAPMGAIVQKGGFGYPFLIAIIFFMVYTIGVIYCKNLKDGNAISPTTAALFPVVMMIPIAAFLTYRAVNDYKLAPESIGKNLKLFFQKIQLLIRSIKPTTH